MIFLRLRDLRVEFPLYQGSNRSLKKTVFANTPFGALKKDAMNRVNVVALRDLNLNIENGDRLALIGPNGAGKTTLLKVLAGIYPPTAGHIRSSGRVTALLTTSVGLNAEATGRENIILRGMYMDIHPREMRARIDEVAPNVQSHQPQSLLRAWAGNPSAHEQLSERRVGREATITRRVARAAVASAIKPARFAD